MLKKPKQKMTSPKGPSKYSPTSGGLLPFFKHFGRWFFGYNILRKQSKLFPLRKALASPTTPRFYAAAAFSVCRCAVRVRSCSSKRSSQDEATGDATRGFFVPFALLVRVYGWFVPKTKKFLKGVEVKAIGILGWFELFGYCLVECCDDFWWWS